VTEQEKILALVTDRLNQAAEALASAELNLSNGLLRSAINRGYYAMFYAVLALLASRQKETSRHSGALALFDRDFIKTALVSTVTHPFRRWPRRMPAAGAVWAE
jgi:uncharacterized protein (UPF0332 family)